MSRLETIDGWVHRTRPEGLERRFLFSDYAETRDFLDRLGDLSEQESIYPNLSFGRDYVNVTIQPEGGDGLDEATLRFSRLVAALVDEGERPQDASEVSHG